MSYERMVLDHPDFTVEQDFHGRWIIKMSAYAKSDTLADAGNELLNKVYEIAQELHKFSSTYVEPTAEAKRTPRQIQDGVENGSLKYDRQMKVVPVDSSTAVTVRPRGPLLKKREEEPTPE